MSFSTSKARTASRTAERCEFVGLGQAAQFGRRSQAHGGQGAESRALRAGRRGLASSLRMHAGRRAHAPAEMAGLRKLLAGVGAVGGACSGRQATQPGRIRPSSRHGMRDRPPRHPSRSLLPASSASGIAPAVTPIRRPSDHFPLSLGRPVFGMPANDRLGRTHLPQDSSSVRAAAWRVPTPHSGYTAPRQPCRGALGSSPSRPDASRCTEGPIDAGAGRQAAVEGLHLRQRPSCRVRCQR